MFLIDTMLVSYVLRDDPLAKLYRSELLADVPLYISIQTVGELRYGAAAKNWSPLRWVKLETLIEEYAILPIDSETAVHYGNIRAIANTAGRPLDSKDAWIIATAKQYGLTMVSHDRDMHICEDIDVKVVCRA